MYYSILISTSYYFIQMMHCIWYNNVFIETTDCGIHLGHPIGARAISDGINKFFIYFNTIMTLFPKAHTNVKYTLFQSYCMSCYGCVLWDFSSNDMQQFYITWRKCIRKLFNYLQTHNVLVLKGIIFNNSHCQAIF